MGYQIKYELTGEAQHITAGKVWMKYVALGLLLLGAVAVTVWSLGTDWTVTVDALESMAKNLGQGSDIKEAFSTFCLDILQGAKLG